ncbi:hypothetical protein [Paenibacillus sp. EKM205P]|uniref:hypothetical protein n=1 Tax=Paenibacillus sp. EKM205P TaxID=1683673 RepID=UPI0013ED26A8|nr:hypothetical protein [Paenibacillus sp. EKM205P]KAF6591062.1 hypothetical protein G9G52_01420 [Paenibacillus sp. EKM205P]
MNGLTKEQQETFEDAIRNLHEAVTAMWNSIKESFAPLIEAFRKITANELKRLYEYNPNIIPTYMMLRQRLQPQVIDRRPARIVARTRC